MNGLTQGMILEMGSYQFLLEVEENTLIIRVIDGPLPEH